MAEANDSDLHDSLRLFLHTERGMKAIIGIGIPGSGKTTYLKPLAAREGLLYVNADDIREEVNGDASDHRRHTYVMRLFHERVQNGLAEKGAVLDMTYSRKKDRLQAVQFCRDHGATEVVAYWFSTPLSVARARNAGRSRIVPEPVLYAMASRLQNNPPSLDEGYDRIVVIED